MVRKCAGRVGWPERRELWEAGAWLCDRAGYPKNGFRIDKGESEMARGMGGSREGGEGDGVREVAVVREEKVEGVGEAGREVGEGSGHLRVPPYSGGEGG